MGCRASQEAGRTEVNNLIDHCPLTPFLVSHLYLAHRCHALNLGKLGWSDHDSGLMVWCINSTCLGG